MSAEEQVKEPPVAGNRRADVIGWTLMCVLGIALVAILTYKVRHASERHEVGQAMMRDYLVQHQCVRLSRPVQNQPQVIRCANGETTEHLLRKKVIGDSWK